VFRFIDTLPDRTVEWWPSARREVQAMATVVPMMFADVGAPLSRVIFAGDAQGHSEGDNGGFGVVAADVSDQTVRECLLVGLRPGLSVTRLDGSFNGRARPDLEFRRGIPFTQLPRSLFNASCEWHDVEAGRWRYADHITLGESRVVVRVARMLAAQASAHRSETLFPEDNRPTACAFMRDRPQSRALNFLLRQRAASSIAAQLQLYMPWVESELQPADALSRLQDPCWPSPL
jgi:hypothetical protein